MAASPKAIKSPKPVTRAYLRSVVMAHLARREASRAILAEVLERRARRRLAVSRLDPDILDLIGATLDELAASGLIDDRRYAAVRARRLEARGFSTRHIARGLRAKGLDRAVIAETLREPIDELAQARAFARRKHLGPWRRSMPGTGTGAGPDPSSGHRLRPAAKPAEKDLRALVRAGFALAIARQALIAHEDAETEEP